MGQLVRFAAMKRIVVAAVAALSLSCEDTTGGGEEPDYALVLAPTALNVIQGATPTVNVSIDRTNFTGGVALFLTGAPAQITGAFNPTSTNTSASVLTITVGGGVPPGVYNLVVNGNGAPGARTAPLPVTVTPAPNYSLEVAPPTLTIARGASDTTTITIARSSFTGAVTLGVSGLPAGVTNLFEPAAPTTSTSRLTLTVGAAVIPGTYDLTVTGNTTQLGDRTAALSLTVPP